MSGNSCDRKFEWLSEQMREMRAEFFVPYQYLSILHQRILKHFLHWYEHEDPHHRSFSRWYNEIKKDFRGELDHISNMEFDTLIDELFAKLGCGECRNRTVYERYRDTYNQIVERLGRGTTGSDSPEHISESVKKVVLGFQFSLVSSDMDISGVLSVFIDALQADSLDIALPMAESACTSLNECLRTLQERNTHSVKDHADKITQESVQHPRKNLSTDEKLDLIIDLLSTSKPVASVKQRSGNGLKLKPQKGIGALSLPSWLSGYKAQFPIPEPYRSWMNALAPHIFWGKVGATRTAFPSYIIKRLGFPDNATLLETWIDGSFSRMIKMYEEEYGVLDGKMVAGFSARASELFDLIRPGNEYLLDSLDSYIRERGNLFELTVLSFDSSSS